MNKTKSYSSQISLWILLAIGLWGGVSVSYETLIGVSACPNIIGLPICYLVTIGYSLMLMSQLISLFDSHNILTPKLFYAGWGVVFAIAAMGVSFELLLTDVCPKSASGLPLCYVSFGLCILILVFYRLHLHYKVSLPSKP